MEDAPVSASVCVCACTLCRGMYPLRFCMHRVDVQGLPTKSVVAEGPVGLESVSQPLNRFSPLQPNADIEGDLPGMGKAS